MLISTFKYFRTDRRHNTKIFSQGLISFSGIFWAFSFLIRSEANVREKKAQRRKTNAWLRNESDPSDILTKRKIVDFLSTNWEGLSALALKPFYIDGIKNSSDQKQLKMKYLIFATTDLSFKWFLLQILLSQRVIGLCPTSNIRKKYKQ